MGMMPRQAVVKTSGFEVLTNHWLRHRSVVGPHGRAHGDQVARRVGIARQALPASSEDLSACPFPCAQQGPLLARAAWPMVWSTRYRWAVECIASAAVLG